MAYDGTPVESRQPLENGQWTGEFTGKEGNKGYQYYDAATGAYYKVPLSDLPSDAGWFMNRQGEYVYGISPDVTHSDDQMGGIEREGSDPFFGKREQAFGPDTGTSVPSGPVDNPNYDPNAGYAPNEPLPNQGGDPFSPKGGGSANTSWDWSQAQPGKFSFSDLPPTPEGYSIDYTLGQDSPWGQSGAEGGNSDFYGQQFNNLLREGQLQKGGEIASAIRRQAADAAPRQEMGDPFAWANGGQGIAPAQAAGGTQENPTAYSLRSTITPGETTNADIMRMFAGEDASKWLQPVDDGTGNNWETSTGWSNARDPNKLINNYLSPDLHNDSRELLSSVFNKMFVQQGIETPEGGGPTASPGYALPVNARS